MGLNWAVHLSTDTKGQLKFCGGGGGGSEVTHGFSTAWEVGAPNSHVVRGSLSFTSHVTVQGSGSGPGLGLSNCVKQDYLGIQGSTVSLLHHPLPRVLVLIYMVKAGLPAPHPCPSP